MSSAKHYIWISDDEVQVKKFIWINKDLQIVNDLELSVVTRHYTTDRNVHLVCPINDPDDLYVNTLEPARLANELLWAGALDTRLRWNIRAGVWLFGPGRGWTERAAEREAERLLKVAISLFSR